MPQQANGQYFFNWGHSSSFSNQHLLYPSPQTLMNLQSEAHGLERMLEGAISQNRNLILQEMALLNSNNIANLLGCERSQLKQGKEGKQAEDVRIVKIEEKEQEQDLQIIKFSDDKEPKPERKNETTKNIVKNYITAIAVFVKKNMSLVKRLLKKYEIPFSSFLQFNKNIKENVISLLDLRRVWSDNNDNDEITGFEKNIKYREMKKCYRILSNQFLRKRCLAHIYNSRIRTTSWHLRYHKKLYEGIMDPSTLTNLKDY